MISIRPEAMSVGVTPGSVIQPGATSSKILSGVIATGHRPLMAILTAAEEDSSLRW